MGHCTTACILAGSVFTCPPKDVAQERDGKGVEFTFLRLNVQFILQQPLSHGSDMRLVLLQVFGKNQDVVEINEDKTVEEISQYIIHQILENRWGICETERHH